MDAGVGATEGEGSSAGLALALALLALQIETVRSLGFQQFFLMYAKLMTGLRHLQVRLLETTPLALHRAVIRVGKPSLEELDWDIEVIWPEMRAPTFMSMQETRPKISLALSTVRSKVCDVGAKLEYERTLHTWAKVVKSFQPGTSFITSASYSRYLCHSLTNLRRKTDKMEMLNG